MNDDPGKKFGEARHLVDVYEIAKSERPAAICMTKEEKEGIEEHLNLFTSLWGDEVTSTALNCRIEIHDVGPMVAFTRDERGLTKVIVCPFCDGPMIYHCPLNLLGLGAPPTQYWCEHCAIEWPSDLYIKRIEERAIRIIHKSIKEQYVSK